MSDRIVSGVAVKLIERPFRLIGCEKNVLKRRKSLRGKI